MVQSYDDAVIDIIQSGNSLNKLGLAPATSGNYSMRIAGDEMAITVSGAHKGQLTSDQVMRCRINGNPLEDKKPSAETLLHCLIYKLYPDINAVLHTHSVPCSVLTRLISDDTLILTGYEMLKAYPNIDTHDVSVSLPIFDNTQNMDYLSKQVENTLVNNRKISAYLIRSHGIYGWGCDMNEARRVIEATEMMLSCEMNIRQMKG